MPAVTLAAAGTGYQREKVNTMPRPAYMLCPECRDGKCRNCTGEALDPDLDELVGCECDHEGLES